MHFREVPLPKPVLAQYGFTILLALILTGIIGLVVSGVAPSVTILFPVFTAPALIGALLGIFLPILSQKGSKKADKE